MDIFQIYDSSGNTYQVNAIPDTCPICRRAGSIEIIQPGIKVFPLEGSGQGSKMHVLCRCPSRTCAASFITKYTVTVERAFGALWILDSFFPFTPKPFLLEDGIAALSPQFGELARQAAMAEEVGIRDIAGLGFRKALEFLVKDYCISKSPDDAEKIKGTLLGPCIAQFVSDVKIKTCAKRATWLGNDEAHYERRWTALDLTDLKQLIRLTQVWISSEILTDAYLGKMPDGGAAPPAKAKGA